MKSVKEIKQELESNLVCTNMPLVVCKEDLYEDVLGGKIAIPLTCFAAIADITSMTQPQLVKFLRKRGILDKDGLPTQKYIEKEWFAVLECKYSKLCETSIIIKPIVLEKGIYGIINELVQNDNVD